MIEMNQKSKSITEDIKTLFEGVAPSFKIEGDEGIVFWTEKNNQISDVHVRLTADNYSPFIHVTLYYFHAGTSDTITDEVGRELRYAADYREDFETKLDAAKRFKQLYQEVKRTGLKALKISLSGTKPKFSDQLWDNVVEKF
jgi:hypothetical protein